MSYENSKKYDEENPKPPRTLLEQSREWWLEAVDGNIGDSELKKWYTELMTGLYYGEVPEKLQQVVFC